MYYIYQQRNPMTTRTVRLDDETEKALTEIQQRTGLSISEALKQGLFAFRDDMEPEKSTHPYTIYRNLNLGEGGTAVAPSTEAKHHIKQILKRKLKR